MKNSKNNQDRKFKNQVNHIHSFIGMPLWNGRNPSLSEIREYDRLILEKQALGFEPKSKSIFRLLVSALMNITSKYTKQITKAGKKTKQIKHEIAKPLNTGTECCG